jgi:hypothetical protein
MNEVSELMRVGESVVRYTLLSVEMNGGLLNAFRNYQAVMV